MNNKTSPEITESRQEIEIDLLELAVVLLRKIWILILCLVIGATAAGLGTKYFITPQYESTSMIYIYSKTTSITSLADLQIGTQLTVDFQIIATTREVIEAAAEELDLRENYETLVKKVTIDNPSNSRILEITVKDSDPRVAAALSNTIADVLRERVAEVMNTDEPSVVQSAVVAQSPVSPSITKNMAIGGILLMLLAAAIIVIRHLMDDTIKTEDDVEKYLGLNVLAVISENTALAAVEHKSGKKRRRRRHQKASSAGKH